MAALQKAAAMRDMPTQFRIAQRPAQQEAAACAERRAQAAAKETGAGAGWLACLPSRGNHSELLRGRGLQLGQGGLRTVLLSHGWRALHFRLLILTGHCRCSAPERARRSALPSRGV